jgi:transcriptional antiterminator
MKDLSSPYDKFKAVYENDKDCNRAKLAEMLDISKRQVYNFIKKFNEST